MNGQELPRPKSQTAEDLMRIWCISFVIVALAGVLNSQAADTFSSPSSQQAFVDKTCAGCHNDKLKRGGFSWTNIDLAHVDQSAELTEKVIRMLRAGMMPPPGIP